MTIREEIDAQFPIRKTTAQKRAFEKWVMAKMREMGYRPYVDGMNRKDKLRHRNIVAGDPQNAELLIISAQTEADIAELESYYDTAATIGVPDLRIPRNFPVYILSQGAVLLGMLLISLLIGTAVGLATKSGDWLILTFFFAYLALMLLMMFGAANKHNVNDNTSGIAALLDAALRNWDGRVPLTVCPHASGTAGGGASPRGGLPRRKELRRTARRSADDEAAC